MLSPDDRIPSLLCQTIYDNPAYFDKIFDNGSVYVGYRLLNGEYTLTCRGSETGEDWLHDIESLGTTEHPILGTIGRGFIIGIDDIYAQIRASHVPTGLVIKIYGHSLGCSHALYLAGLFIRDGFVVEVVAFEPPRSCGQPLIDVLAPYPVRCYRNGEDFVTQVPVVLRHPRELIQLNCPPVSGDLTPFRYHHAQLIACGIAMQQGGFI